MLQEFKKETEDRKRIARQQEAIGKITLVEAAVQKNCTSCRAALLAGCRRSLARGGPGDLQEVRRGGERGAGGARPRQAVPRGETEGPGRRRRDQGVSEPFEQRGRRLGKGESCCFCARTEIGCEGAGPGSGALGAGFGGGARGRHGGGRTACRGRRRTWCRVWG